MKRPYSSPILAPTVEDVDMRATLAPNRHLELVEQRLTHCLNLGHKMHLNAQQSLQLTAN